MCHLQYFFMETSAAPMCLYVMTCSIKVFSTANLHWIGYFLQLTFCCCFVIYIFNYLSIVVGSVIGCFSFNITVIPSWSMACEKSVKHIEAGMLNFIVFCYKLKHVVEMLYVSIIFGSLSAFFELVNLCSFLMNLGFFDGQKFVLSGSAFPS